MTIAPFAFAVFARVNSPKARPVWKACGQSLPALSARVLLRAGIDHILPTLSAPRRSANMPALRRSDEWGLRGGPAWPRRADASDPCGRIRNEENRIHAPGLARRASSLKPILTCLIEIAELSVHYSFAFAGANGHNSINRKPVQVTAEACHFARRTLSTVFRHANERMRR